MFTEIHTHYYMVKQNIYLKAVVSFNFIGGAIVVSNLFGPVTLIQMMLFNSFLLAEGNQQ
jgi:hypothetical protein